MASYEVNLSASYVSDIRKSLSVGDGTTYANPSLPNEGSTSGSTKGTTTTATVAVCAPIVTLAHISPLVGANNSLVHTLDHHDSCDSRLELNYYCGVTCYLCTNMVRSARTSGGDANYIRCCVC